METRLKQSPIVFQFQRTASKFELTCAAREALIAVTVL